MIGAWLLRPSWVPRKNPVPAAYFAVVPSYPLASYAYQFAAGLYLSSTCTVHTVKRFHQQAITPGVQENMPSFYCTL
jgi:hypothetical protein